VNLSYQAHEHRASSRSQPLFGRCGTSFILSTYKTLRADPPVSSVSTPGIATSYLRDEETAIKAACCTEPRGPRRSALP
jgi:hypothetical protein